MYWTKCFRISRVPLISPLSSINHWLRKKRAEIAQQKRVPAYIIFHDKSLEDMAEKAPQTVEAFGEVLGVGAKKRDQYADVFIAHIREYSKSS